MQTSKIKIGSEYALPRDGSFVRFHVTEIVTRKTSEDTVATSKIVGWVVEDQREGKRIDTLNLDPKQLEGPYEEQIELVARKAKEALEQAAKAKAETEQALAERLALYAFVGVEAPEEASKYDQHFRVGSGYSREVTIERKGVRAIVARVYELSGDMEKARTLRVVK